MPVQTVERCVAVFEGDITANVERLMKSCGQ